MTDGEPSDTNFNSLRNQIQTRPPETFVTFIMCTSEDSVVDAYQSCIDPIKGVDIVDDYKSEKKLCEGHGNKLSFNMYLGKCLMGAKLDKYGREYRVFRERGIKRNRERARKQAEVDSSVFTFVF